MTRPPPAPAAPVPPAPAGAFAGTGLAAVDRADLAARAGPVPRRTHVLLRYDRRRYPFAELLCRDVFRVPRLDRLHAYLGAQRAREGRPPRPTRRDNLTLRAMMERQPPDAPFLRLYHAFMLRTLAPLVGRGLSYTSTPKLRIHLPGTPGVSAFHHDICVTGRIDQINFWMPFTDVAGTATLWLESGYGRGDYAPVPVRYGEVLVFDGGYLGHGTVANDTDTTRASLDMRFSFKGARTRADGVALMDRMIAALARPAAPGPDTPPPAGGPDAPA